MTRVKKAVTFGCLGLGTGVLVFLLALMGAFRFSPASPFEKDDICFTEDQPGATARFTVYTPVRCSDETQHLGPELGADHASLDFEDLDGDGTPEVIVAPVASMPLSVTPAPASCKPGRLPSYIPPLAS